MLEADRLQSIPALRRNELVQEGICLRRKLARYKDFSKFAAPVGIIVPVFVGSSLASSADIEEYQRSPCDRGADAAALTVMH
jgi:hypothetical protein